MRGEATVVEKTATAAVSKSSRARRILAFVGPGYLVAVGYMDPGNWATSLAAGSKFGYALLSVVLLSSLMAMLLQAAAIRLGVVLDADLAQCCRRYFPAPVNLGLWLACEIAIVACNLAEMLGMAYGLYLLFGIPLRIGVCLCVLDVLLLLELQRRGARAVEAIIIALTLIVASSFAIELVWLNPPLAAIAAGFAPPLALLSRPEVAYLAVGIIGATVMPHNLYLHSSLVKHRLPRHDDTSVRRAIRFATLDSNLALSLALLVNACILILAAGAFYSPAAPHATSLGEAYRLLSPALGVGAASTVFGVGLIASGLSSSMTGALAGQIVMQGFLDIRLARKTRALVTRALALVPAMIAAVVYGNAGIDALLVFTQVVLGLQLPLAVLPLLWFTTRVRYMGSHAFPRWIAALLWSVGAIVTVVNLQVVLA
jgi:manganese transport protein